MVVGDAGGEARGRRRFQEEHYIQKKVGPVGEAADIEENTHQINR